jgi:hypothetical protein
MPGFTASVVISRPQQEVFDYLTDWTSTGRPDVGSTMTARMKSRSMGGELQLEVTHWDPPHGYDDRMLNTVFPVKDMRHEYRFAPDGSATRVTLNGEFKMMGALAFAGGLMRKVATKFNQQHLDAAKRLLEAG